LAGHLPLSSIGNYFGSLGNALVAAGLDRTVAWSHFEGRGNVLSDDDLFRSMKIVEQCVGHEPRCLEYQSQGGYSARPFRKRFGKWDEVLTHYRKWKAQRSGGKPLLPGVSASLESAQNSAVPPCVNPEKDETQMHEQPKSNLVVRRAPQLYGEPIEFLGLRHAPINEQGVVYLFGMVSRELGFSIEALQQGFPDCEGKYLYDKKKNHWAKARIEFEFKASNFREHGHPSDQCDFIVCWQNDWPDCPISVKELSKEILKLPSN
jgi:hypothetical protein